MSETDIENLKRVIDHQANMKTLWSDPYNRKQTMQEAILKAALRHIHAVVEGDSDAAFRAYRVYWNLESDL